MHVESPLILVKGSGETIQINASNAGLVVTLGAFVAILFVWEKKHFTKTTTIQKYMNHSEISVRMVPESCQTYCSEMDIQLNKMKIQGNSIPLG